MSDMALDYTLERSDVLYGDILIENGDLSLLTGFDAIEQHLKQRLKTFYGEWFLNKKVGVPYFEQVFVKNYNANILDSVFKKIIIETPGIIQLLEFSLEIDSSTRELFLTFKASAVEGVIDFSEAIP